MLLNISVINMLFATKLVCLLLCVELTVLEVVVGSVKELGCANFSAINICENTVTVEYYCNVQSKNLIWKISRTFGTDETIVLGEKIVSKVEVFDTGTARLISVGADNGRSDVSGAVSTLNLNITVASTDGRGDITVSCQDIDTNISATTCRTIDLTSNTPVPTNVRKVNESQNGEFTIGWDFDFGITGYIINISPPPSAGLCAKGICSVDLASSCTDSSCVFVISHLDYSTEYHITLQSVNCAGRSVKTEPLTKPARGYHSSAGMLVKITSSTASLFSHDASHVVPTLSLTAQHLPSSSSILIQGSNTSNPSQLDSILWMALLIGATTLSAIICTPSLALVIAWCCIVTKKRQSKQKEPPNDDTMLKTVNPSHLASGYSYTYDRNEPIYDVPSWTNDTDNSKTRSSMMYNGAYRGGFVMSTNIAYQDDFIISENDAYGSMSKV